MSLMPMPYDAGFSDGERGLQYHVPQEYTVYEAEQFRKGYDQGYDLYRKKVYEMNHRRENHNYGPYLDDRWIPKNGGYGL